MSSPAIAEAATAGGERLGGLDRLLTRLPAVAAASAVALYLTLHRELVLGPGGELLAALTAGSWAPDLAVLASFARLLAPPAALLAALAAAIWPWSRYYDRRPTSRLLATLTLTSALVVALQVALGAAGLLRPSSLALAAGGLALAMIAVGRLRRPAGRPAGAATGGRGPARLTGGRMARLAGRLELAPPTGLGLALGGLTAASWLALAAVGGLLPPWGWDTLVYHLTDVFWFARSGALEPFPHPAYQFHLPKAAELHSLWFYLLAGGGAEAWRVTGIAQLPLALTAGVAVRAAGEVLGLRSALPWLAPATMLVPLALIQPLAGYTDLAFAAFLLAAVAFLLAALRRGRAADWALAALAVGLALGSKPSFAVLCLPLVALVAPRRQRRRRPPRRLLLVAVCALTASVGCGYWLLPKLVATGNPLHPVAVSLGGRILLDGPAVLDAADANRGRYVASTAGWLVYPFDERYMGRTGYSPDSGFGAQFAAAWVALPFALALAARRRRRLLGAALLAAPALFLLWLALSPFEHPRYALAACALTLLALAAVEEAASAGAAASPLARRLVRSAVVAALLFSAPAALLAAAPELARAAARWKAGDWAPGDLYPLLYGGAGSAFNWLSERGGEGTTVSFDRPTFVAPLFGWHGRNRVVYAAALDEPGLTGQPFTASSGEWLRFLERERVDWLVVWRPWWAGEQRPTLRQRWIDVHPGAFEELAVFDQRARILAPRPAAAVASTTDPELAAPSSGAGWVIEHASGTAATVEPDPAGGLRVDYRFLRPGPDYLDLRFDLEEGGWPADGRLEIGLDSPTGSPQLWVYLKEAEARRSCRFRIAPRPATATPGVVVIDLAQPDAATPDFAIGRVASLHLVLDDGGGVSAPAGSLRVTGFRLLPAKEDP